MNPTYPAKIKKTEELITEARNRALSSLTEELQTKLLEATALGKSILTFCRENNLQEESVKAWLYYDKDLQDTYRMAQEESHLARFEEIENLSEEALWQVKSFENNAKMQRFAQVLLNAYELRINTLKWKLSKINPRRYSEKMDITSGGRAIGGNTIVFADFSKEQTPIIKVKDENEEK